MVGIEEVDVKVNGTLPPASELSWDRRLFRKVIVLTSGKPGLGMQVLAVAIFLFRAYSSQVIYLTDTAIKHEHTPLYVFAPLWFIYGFIYEYSVLLLGRKLMIRWMGWRIISSILHFICFILLLQPFLDPNRMSGDEFRHLGLQFDAGFLVTFALYLFALQAQMMPRHQLAKVYQSNISLDSDEVGHRLVKETIKSLGLDLHEQSVEEWISTFRMRSPDDTMYLIEELSNFHCPAPVAYLNRRWQKKKSNNGISALQYRDFANQLVLNAEKASIDEESSSLDFTQRTLPLSAVAFVAALTDKWTKVPIYLVLTFVAMLMQASVMPLQSLFLGSFVNALVSLDSYNATVSLAVWSSLLLVSSVADSLVAIFMSGLNAIAIDKCKKQVLSVILSGGTEFMQAFPNVSNTFSSHMGTLEFLLINATYTLLLSLLQLIMGIIFAFRVYFTVGFVFLAMIPVIYSVDTVVKLALETSEESARKLSEVDLQFSSTMNCIPVIRATDSKTWAMSKLKGPMDYYCNARRKSILWGSLVESYYAIWGNFYLAVIVIPWGAHALQNHVSSGDFTTLVTLAMGMVTPLITLGGFLRKVTTDAGSIIAIEELLHQGAKLEDSKSPSGANLELDKLKNELDVKHVVFAYPGSKGTRVLKGVDVRIARGTYVCLCGTSGSGKSTLLELLMQNREPSEGTIEWDGTDISDCTRASFRRHVGVMFQKTMIIKGSVYENIAFGLETNLKDVKKAAEMAEIASAIEALPNGYETVIGGGAIDLSGGQLQRICLARVIHRKCSVLLLDEATSALDPVSEAAIVKTILHLRDLEGLTIISVTHHPVTAVDADEIIVLDKGVIAERGTYECLVENENGIFHKMVNTENEK